MQIRLRLWRAALIIATVDWGRAHRSKLTIDAARRSARYVESLNTRELYPSTEALECLQQLDQPLQDESVDPFEVLEILDTIGSHATVASTAGR